MSEAAGSEAAGGDAARGFAIARTVTSNAGRTYYLASRLLPARRRRAVHALYAFARIVDDAVDGERPAPAAADRVDLLEAGLAAALAGSPAPDLLRGDDADILAALAEAVHDNGIGVDTFEAFIRSMRMDIPGTDVFRNRYRTFDELADYTCGSAGVIGLQLVPILGADTALADGAALLGEAFQLTNFLRDVAEDLRRDRIYLPLDELAAFGVDEASLHTDLARGSASRPLRRAVAHLIAVNRDQYRRATPFVARLPGASRPAITAAARSYGDILRVIEETGHDVVAARAVVPTRTRIGHAIAALPTAVPAPSRVIRTR
ncbi:phytoene/squalene synthase family protein [Gordonia liuliyuniae]|uniref:Phytoene/squalene synthase family protein n=1 Tax=Gordonia liuliyuniae TaxID=2911517 RepID=A0ABS9IUR5_9ACTN|nr:phytoene/squalene synthase family protein [Gordonia liuliyuniae]MCF8589304.1 phytoene/squalene synthase family protein [Gordonia liuliyuniae]